jgi:hypothetical protein
MDGVCITKRENGNACKIFDSKTTKEGMGDASTD